MSGRLVIEQAKAGHTDAEGGGGVVIVRPQQGGVVTLPQLIAKLRNSRNPQCVAALLLISNRVLLIGRVVYLYRWRRFS